MNRIIKNNGLIILGLFCLLIIPNNVFAHPGRTDSSDCHKCNGTNTNCSQWGLSDGEYHCHSGNTYSNSKGEVFDKSGTKISGDNSSNNSSTEKEESDSNNNSNSTQDKPLNNSGESSNNSTTTQKPSTFTPKPVEKSKDVTLKIVKVDDNVISIEDQMQYETNNRNIELNIEAIDSKAKVEFDNKELTIGENEIIIKVTAEAGNSKEYKLIINRKEIQSEVVIKKFILGTSEVKFEDNKASIKKLTTETDFEYSYELSDKNAKLLLYVNDKEVSKLNNIKNEDIIKLVVIDNDDNKNIYEIKVTEASATQSAIINAIAYTIVAGIFLSPIIVVGLIIYFKKIKKNKTV